MFRAEDISFSLGRHQIFSDVNFTCTDGKMLAFEGPSGCGKTTLLNITGMLIRPTTGSLTYGGKHVRSWEFSKRRSFWREKCAFIYQDYGIIDDETLAFNVTLRHTWRRNVQDARRLGEILESVGLSGREGERASVFSGGEKQRLGIARALWKNAHIIFADEPTASLDAENRQMVTDLLVSHATKGGIVLTATHDAELVRACTSVYALGEK